VGARARRARATAAASSSARVSSAGDGGSIVIGTGPFGNVEEVAALNTSNDEDDPTFTADGLELYFNSDRSGTSGLWRATRASTLDPWGSVEAVDELNAAGGGSNCVVAPDGLTMWLSRSATIYVTTRSSRSDPWTAPTDVAELSAGGGGVMGAVTTDLLFAAFSSNRPGAQASGNLWATSRASANDPWSGIAPIMELNTGSYEGEPWLSPDGLHLYWSASDGTGNTSIFRSVRATTSSSFDPREEVTELNSGQVESDPWLLPNQRYMLFVRGPVGGGARDIYSATR
jgi:Tol biopolymer transport system component